MSAIDYEHRLDEALRGVVRGVMLGVSEDGLPDGHHFYITFRTEWPGVYLSEELRGRYPEEMTVVLQHQFWNLLVGEESFSVTLRFSGVEERIEVPWSSITVFADPSAEFGLQLQAPGSQSDSEGEDAESAMPSSEMAPGGDGHAEVVRLDDFRR